MSRIILAAMLADTTPPLFVVGALRSGTTLFRLMLSQHPNIDIPGEFEEAVSQLSDFGWIDVADYLEFLETDRAFRQHDFAVDASLDYPSLVRSFYAQMRERTQKPIVGASIHSRFDRCPDLWPDARYIHVLRDPRDVARSCVGMGWVGNAVYGADIWVEAECRWRRLRARLDPEQYCEVRYEELVRAPEESLSAVCEFLGLSYDPKMLDFDQHSTYSKPDARLAEQWKSKLPVREIRLIERRCGALLTDRGYEPSGAPPLHPSLPEQAYWFVDHRLRRLAGSVERLGLTWWTLERIAKLSGSRRLRRATQLKRNEVAEALLK